MEKSYLVFDIETVPEDEPKQEEKQQKEEDKEAGSQKSFPPTFKHRIITIGVLWLSERLNFKKLGIFSEGKKEKAVVADFNAFVAKNKPVLVSYNGRRFDLPVIMLRSLKYGLNMEWFVKTSEYSRRYPPTKHLDLCDILAEYGAASYTSLDNMSHLVGLAGKKGMEGSKVKEEFEKGNLELIRNYCLHDVVLTGCVFLRYLLVSGDLTPAAYNISLDSCIAGISGDERLSEFISPDELAAMKV